MHGSEGKDFVSKFFIKFDSAHSGTKVIPKYQVRVLDSALGSGTKWINFFKSGSANFEVPEEHCGNSWHEVATTATWNIESILGMTLTGTLLKF